MPRAELGVKRSPVQIRPARPRSPWQMGMLTEQVRVDDYPLLSRTLEQLRSFGVRLVIDDTGAGFASLAHILKLAPDLIKLDRELTSGIDQDPVRSRVRSYSRKFRVLDRGGDHRRRDRDRWGAERSQEAGHPLRLRVRNC